MPRGFPKGVLSRIPPDFFADGGMSGYGSSPGVTAKMSELVLYNNATDGSLLKLYGMELFSNNNQAVILEPIKGSFGSPATNPAQNIRFDQPLGWGQVLIGASAVCIGFGAIMQVAAINIAQLFIWPGFPMAVIPPGYGVSWEGTVVNNNIIGGFFWLPVQA